jgi:hypothetical protein
MVDIALTWECSALAVDSSVGQFTASYAVLCSAVCSLSIRTTLLSFLQ